MKIQKVLALCKKRRQATIFELNGEQWVHTGGAYYKLDGMPMIDKESEFCALAGIDPDKSAVQMDEAPALIEFDDYTAAAATAREMEVDFCLGDSRLHGFQTEEDVIAVLSDYLSMFSDNDLVFQLRKIETLTGKIARYICVLEGFILKACIFETKFTSNPYEENAVEDIKALYEELKEQIEDDTKVK